MTYWRGRIEFPWRNWSKLRRSSCQGCPQPDRQ